MRERESLTPGMVCINMEDQLLFYFRTQLQELVSQYKNSQATMGETKGKNLFTPAGEPLFVVYC